MYTNNIGSLSELASALVLLVDPLQTVAAALLDGPSLPEDVDEVLGLDLGEVVMTLAVLFIHQRLRAPKTRTRRWRQVLMQLHLTRIVSQRGHKN